MTDTMFELDIGLPDPSDPYNLFPESVFVDSQTLLEETVSQATDTTKQSLWKRLWEMIKRTWRRARDLFTAIIRGIKDLVKRKGRPKSADQIAMNVMGPQAAANMASKPFAIAFNSDADGFAISPVIAVIKTLAKGPKIKGHETGYESLIIFAARCIKEPWLLDNPIKIFREIKEAGKISGEPPNAFDDWVKIAFTTVSATWTVTYDQLVHFQTKLNEFVELTDYWEDFNQVLDSSSLTAGQKERWTENLNQIAAISIFMQLGLNMVGASFQTVHEVDKGLKHSMDNIGQIADFAAESIQAGHLYKYIANNINILASPRLNQGLGDPPPEGESGELATGGMTRIVMFPADKNIVYKIAGNEQGRKANRTEYRIFKELDRTPDLKKLFAGTYEAWPAISGEDGGYVVSSERVKPLSGDDVPTMKWRLQFKAKMDAKLGELGHKWVVADLNKHGWGQRPDGSLVILDYGYGARRL